MPPGHMRFLAGCSGPTPRVAGLLAACVARRDVIAARPAIHDGACSNARGSRTRRPDDIHFAPRLGARSCDEEKFPSRRAAQLQPPASPQRARIRSSSALISTGLTRWWSKPASCAACTSCGWPKPVMATTVRPAPAGCSRMRATRVVAAHARHADVQQHQLRIEGRRPAAAPTRRRSPAALCGPSPRAAAPASRRRRGCRRPPGCAGCLRRRARRSPWPQCPPARPSAQRPAAAARRTGCPCPALRCRRGCCRHAVRPACASAPGRCPGRRARGSGRLLLREHLEHAFQPVRRDADAAVAHREHAHRRPRSTTRSSMLPARVGVLGRVGQQVHEDLRQPRRGRRAAAACPAGCSTVSLWPRAVDLRPDGLDGIGQHLVAARPRRVRSSMLPWLMRLTSIRSSIRRPIAVPAGRSPRRPTARRSWPGRAACRKWTALRTGASGLRSSCASVARNSSLRRLASRSCASLCCSSAVRSVTRWSRVSFSSRSCSSARRRSVTSASSSAVGALELAALAVQLGEHRDLGAQDRRVHRLVQVVHRAGAVALEHVLVLVVVGGEEDDRDARGLLALLDHLRQLEAGHARHPDVEHQQRRIRRPSSASSASSAGLGADQPVAGVVEDRLEHRRGSSARRRRSGC